MPTEQEKKVFVIAAEEQKTVIKQMIARLKKEIEAEKKQINADKPCIVVSGITVFSADELLEMHQFGEISYGLYLEKIQQLEKKTNETNLRLEILIQRQKYLASFLDQLEYTILKYGFK